MKQHISYVRVQEATKITFHIVTISASTFILLLHPNISQNNTETQNYFRYLFFSRKNIKSLSDLLFNNFEINCSNVIKMRTYNTCCSVTFSGYYLKEN